VEGCLALHPACVGGCGDLRDARRTNKDLRTYGGKPAYSLIRRNLELNACIANTSDSSHTTEPLFPRPSDIITVVLN